MIPEIKEVLIYSALTQLEYDLNRIGFRRVNEIPCLEQKRRLHDAHYRGLERIVEEYRKNGIDPVVRERESLGVEDLEKEWGLIQPYGGDRTFLKIASLVRDDTLLMGIKSKRSSYGAHYNSDLSNAPEHIARVLRNKGVSVEKRARIFCSWPGFDGDLAANDLFVGKRYTMSYTRLAVSGSSGKAIIGSNGILVSTYRGGPGWYNNILTRNLDPSETKLARKALIEAGLPGDLIEISDPRAAFREGDETCLRYKSINTKEAEGPDYGIIACGQSLEVSALVPGCVVSFDGIEPGENWPRCFEIKPKQSVTISLSDRPLHVVKFDQVARR